MSDLLDILRNHEEAICDAVAEKLRLADCEAFGQATAGGCPAVLELVADYSTGGDRSKVRTWARALSDEANRLGLSPVRVLSGLSCLGQSIRVEIFKHLSHKVVLLAVLNEADEAVDFLRRCYAESRFDAEGQVHPQRHELAALAEESEDFICLATLYGKPFFLNGAGRRLVGLEDDAEIASTSLHECHAEDSWVQLRDVAVPAVNSSGRWEGSSRLSNRKTGQVIDVETTMFLVRGPQTGKPSCLAVIHRNADRSPAIDEALAETEARKHAILESALDPIITINHEGVITEFNRAAEKVFGHSRDDVLGTQPSEILFPPAKIAGYRDRIDRYLAAGEGSMLSKRIEVTAVRANGETFPAEMAMTLNRERGLPVLTFFVRDISHQKQAEKDHERYAAELERSNQELEQFAYAASHDLQEPLRKIRTFSDRLQMKCGDSLDETGRECLERMQNAAERMQALINGLLTLSRVTTRAQNFVPVDVARVAGEVVSDLEVQIEQALARVEVGKLPTLQADPLQIRQLLQNLIGNALKFRREEEPPVVKVHGRFVKGRLERRAGESPADEQCRIVVEDNGIGFPEKYAERIFGVFQRLHPRDVYQGTGVGLAICRKIVERHGGTITARSTPHRGSSFEVVLPVVQPRQEK